MIIIDLLDTLLGIVFIVSMVLLGFIDLRKRIIPDFFHPLLFAMGLVRIAISGDPKRQVLSSLLASVLVALPMALFNIYKRAFGGGDVKLLASAGFFLGVYSLSYGATISFLGAGIFAFFFKLYNKLKARAVDEIPFGPFLAFGLSYAYLITKADIFNFLSCLRL